VGYCSARLRKVLHANEKTAVHRCHGISATHSNRRSFHQGLDALQRQHQPKRHANFE
jgi:hypothetical protein